MKRNILIAYYSYSGKTREIAEMIQKQTGGKLSQIYPRQPYPADFESLLHQVREESTSEKFPTLLPLTENAGKYDIIFAGSPNWCGTIAPPLAAWLKGNNITGKILLPFFSHCGGEDRGMEEAVRELCPSAEMGSSLYVLENVRENLQDMVQAWLGENFLQKERNVDNNE
ncbi:MAG: flavodoxin family protein [Ruminococcus sp.]